MNRINILVFVYLIAHIKAARILVYIPTPSISHQEPFRPLTQELARRGHDVTIITTDPAFPKGKSPSNLTEIDLHDFSYDLIKKTFIPLTRGNPNQWIEQIKYFVFEFFIDLLDKQFETAEVKKVLSDRKFDLLILESIARPLLGLTHIIKAPTIFVSSLGPLYDNADAIGAPTHPILYASNIRQKLSNLTFWDKISELHNYYKTARMAYSYEEIEQKMLQKHFGSDMPTINELRNNIDMLFLNMHPIFEGNHPVPPSVVYMWGIHKRPKQDLPNDLKTFLDNSNHGVIYMSFGTNTDPTLLPANTIQMFVKVFCQLPYDVLWKWNSDELPGRCKNIRIAKWFPQSDLLRHPKVKLFITQGGIQSTDEAISAGVPLIGIPMIGDQFYNVEKYVQLNIGARLDLETISEERLRDAVTTVISNESYSKNIKKLDALMRDEPMPALERAVWWVEHVLRHGGAKHLRAPAANISWAQYLEVELILIVLLVLVLILSLGCIIIYYVYKFLRQFLGASTKIKSN